VQVLVRRLSGAARLKDKKGKKLRCQFRQDIRISAQLLAPLFSFFVFFSLQPRKRGCLKISTTYQGELQPMVQRGFQCYPRTIAGEHL
jgi:hypothetical protein